MKKPNEYKIQKRKDNRWYVQVRHKGHTYCIYGKTKKEAQEKLVCKIRQLQEATLNGIDIISAEMKLKDWAELCVETYSKQNVRGNTYSSYLTIVKYHLKEIGDKKLNEINNNMNPVRTMRFERHNRISQGHKITVKYAFSLTV